MPELIAFGSEPSQRWQKAIPEGTTIRLGRSPRKGWRIPWDNLISREHAEITLEDQQLHVRCLDTARNPIYFRENQETEFSLTSGEGFLIGETRFQFVEGEGDITSERADPLQELAYDDDELTDFPFGMESQRLAALSELPKLITHETTNDGFAQQLSALVLNATPKAYAVAVVCFDVLDAGDWSRPAILEWRQRSDYHGSFKPSRRLIRSVLHSGKSLLYAWPEGDSGSDFTGSGNLDWAFCVPIGSSSSEGWCIYVAGQREEGESLGKVFLEKNERKGDLRFARHVAEFVTSIREARRLQAQQDEMNQFFSPTVVETLSRTIDTDQILDPREQDISVLFCDVRGFSRRAEKERHALHDLLNRVSEALGVMTKAIVKYEDVIADFQGDAALAFWGWPQTLDDGPISACRAALEMLRQFRLANQDRSSPLAGFQVGIGIGHGRAIAGKIGSAEQSKVGVFGPVVNLASRLEGMTKQFRVPILMDEATAEYVRRLLPADVARTRRLGRVRPLGMDDSVMVSELLPPQAEDDSVLDELLTVHEVAVETFHRGHWTEAYDLLEETPVSNRAKEVLAIYTAEHGYSPPDDWDGVIELKSK